MNYFLKVSLKQKYFPPPPQNKLLENIAPLERILTAWKEQGLPLQTRDFNPRDKYYLSLSKGDIKLKYQKRMINIINYIMRDSKENLEWNIKEKVKINITCVY